MQLRLSIAFLFAVIIPGSSVVLAQAPVVPGDYGSSIYPSNETAPSQYVSSTSVGAAEQS